MSWFSWGSKAASPEPASPSTTAAEDGAIKVVGRGQHHQLEVDSSRPSLNCGGGNGVAEGTILSDITPTLSFGEGGGSSVSMHRQHSMRPTRVTLRLELRQSLDILTAQLARINLGAPTSTLGGVATPTAQSGGGPNDRSRCYTVLRYYEAATLVGHIRLLLSALNQESQLDIARDDDDELEAAILHRDAMRCSQQQAEARKPLTDIISSFPLICYSPLFNWGGDGMISDEPRDDDKESAFGQSSNSNQNAVLTLASLQDAINKCIGWDGSNHHSQSCTNGSDDFKALQTCISRALLDRSDELEKLLLHAANEVNLLSQQHPVEISDVRRHMSCVLLQCLITDLNRAALMLSTTSSNTLKAANGPQYAALLSDMACFAKSIINKRLDQPQQRRELSNCGATDSDRQAILSSVVAEAMAAIDDALILSATVTPTPSPSTAAGKINNGATASTANYCVLSGVAIPIGQHTETEEEEGSEDAPPTEEEDITALRIELRRWIKSGSIHPFVGRYLHQVI